MTEQEQNGRAEAAAVDIENIMLEVRRQVLAGESGEPISLPQTLRELPAEFYEHVYQAGLLQSRLGLRVDVVKSGAPLVGPLLDRARALLHQLVVYYVNRLADQQNQINGHILRALSLIEESPDSETSLGPGRGRPALRRASLDANGERATPDDVYLAYRLLLDREPNEREWDYWAGLVEKHSVSRAYIVDSFLNGHEFQAMQRERSEPRLVDLGPFQMYLRPNDNFISAEIAATHRYEAHVTRVIDALLRPGDAFIDVGANIGYFALLAAARVGPDGRVAAFEPNPANCGLIERSVAANDFGGWFALFPNAVADRAGTLRFSAGGIEGNGRVVNPAEADLEKTPLPLVAAVPLDDLLDRFDRVDLIKIDVEGAEARVWQGMRRLVERFRPVVVFEFSPVLLQVTSEVEPARFLADVGSQYDLYIIPREGEVAGRPDSAAAILEAYHASGLTHLDLLARPRA
jgi:FkbM family methyltransferase